MGWAFAHGAFAHRFWALLQVMTQLSGLLEAIVSSRQSRSTCCVSASGIFQNIDEIQWILNNSVA